MNSKSTLHLVRRLSLCFAVLCALAALAPRALSQGCMPAHYLSLTLGAQGASYLQPGEWEADLGYRYLHSERVFIGGEEAPQFQDVGGKLWMNSFDLSATYALTRRFSLSLTLPFMQADYSTIQGDLQRHTGSAAGLGDLRLVANAWLFDPAANPNGNITFGLGVKAPTGDDHATDSFYTPDGPIDRPVDIAAQPGDGGWGMLVEMQAFQKLYGNFFGYASGFYLFNPRQENGTPVPSPSIPLVNSVPDQYFGRIGLSYVFWPSQGFSVSFGGRIDGIPVEDVIGGSEGFRRAGYAISVDPGLNWASGKNSLSVNVPVAIERHFERSVVDLEQSAATGRHIATRGAFADFLIVASYSRRF